MIGSPGTERALIELAGVAGSGKSTVTSNLTPDSMARAPFISARDPSQVGLFVLSLPRLTPLVAANFRHPPRMTWADYKLMVYVTTWDRHLEGGTGSLLFDQGPLYALVRLKAKGIGVTATPVFDEWWSEMLTKWLDRISLVVWLDAPDEILMKRINQRDQAHLLKNAPPRESKGFLERYRALFDEIAAVSEARGRPAIHRIDTGSVTAEEVAGMVAQVITRHQEATDREVNS